MAAGRGVFAHGEDLAVDLIDFLLLSRRELGGRLGRATFNSGHASRCCLVGRRRVGGCLFCALVGGLGLLNRLGGGGGGSRSVGNLLGQRRDIGIRRL